MSGLNANVDSGNPLLGHMMITMICLYNFLRLALYSGRTKRSTHEVHMASSWFGQLLIHDEQDGTFHHDSESYNIRCHLLWTIWQATVKDAIHVRVGLLVSPEGSAVHVAATWTESTIHVPAGPAALEIFSYVSVYQKCLTAIKMPIILAYCLSNLCARTVDRAINAHTVFLILWVASWPIRFSCDHRPPEQ